MFRLLRLRLLSALLAVVYIALPGGAFGVRPCAHHDSVAATTVDGVEGAEPDTHAHHAPASTEDADAGDAHGGCSCLATCAASGAIVLHTDPSIGTAAADSEWTPNDNPAYDAPRSVRPPHFLPYPHGPPADPS